MTEMPRLLFLSQWHVDPCFIDPQADTMIQQAISPGSRRQHLFKHFGRSPQAEEKTTDALDRTRRTWFRRVAGLFERSRIDDELWQS